MPATYDEIFAVSKKVAQSETLGYTCHLNTNTVLKKLSYLYEMLKRVEDPTADVKHQKKWQMCVDKLFDISKDIDLHLSSENYLIIQDQRVLWR